MPRIQATITPKLSAIGKAFKGFNIGSSLQKQIERYAFAIEAGAKTTAPVLTGRLRASIMTDIGDLRAKVAPHVDYAGFVHEGTRFIAPRPFMIWGREQADSRGFGVQGITAGITSEIEGRISDIK